MILAVFQISYILNEEYYDLNLFMKQGKKGRLSLHLLQWMCFAINTTFKASEKAELQLST